MQLPLPTIFLIIPFMFFSARSPIVGAAILFLASDVIYLFMGTTPFVILVGHLSLGHMVGITLTMAFVIRWLNGDAREGTRSIVFKVLLALAALFSVLALRGLMINPLSPTIYDLTPFFFLFSSALYFSSFGYGQKVMRGFFRLCILVAVLTLVVVALRWLQLVPTPDILFSSGGSSDWYGWRVLDVRTTMFLALVLLGLLMSKANRVSMPTIWGNMLMIGLVVAVVMLQIRSVWFALGVGMLLLLWFRSSIVIYYYLGALGLLFLILIFQTLQPHVLMSVFGSLAQAIDTIAGGDLGLRYSTTAWRYLGWQYALQNMQFSNWLAGVPFGSSVSWLTVSGDWYEVGASPHNFFVLVLLRTGFPALALLVSLICYVLVKMRKLAVAASHHSLLAKNDIDMLWIAFSAYQVFVLFYDPNADYGMLLGICISIVALSPQLTSGVTECESSGDSAHYVVAGARQPS